ncbi:MAG: cob(I)yrinic acid a,c-diamide adenosyltransferase [Actinobacteria bacterium]|nr:cob(I)yrinic acid a,c-diamide adenosyltransferase [Actinomycetota bacterium]
MSLGNKKELKHQEDECRKNVREGLVLINTGNGKGKTTAALGLALRAAGHNLKVLILQFIKGSWKTGEAKAIEKWIPLIDIEQLGKGFINFKNGKPVISKENIDNARESFKYALDKINSNQYDVVILDEINNLISYGLLRVGDAVSLIKNKPAKLSIILTGRNAPKELIDIADTVTEMKEIKHAFSSDIKAKKGIEY